jgi:hypothetical protein
VKFVELHIVEGTESPTMRIGRRLVESAGSQYPQEIVAQLEQSSASLERYRTMQIKLEAAFESGEFYVSKATKELDEYASNAGAMDSAGTDFRPDERGKAIEVYRNRNRDLAHSLDSSRSYLSTDKYKSALQELSRDLDRCSDEPWYAAAKRRFEERMTTLTNSVENLRGRF